MQWDCRKFTINLVKKRTKTLQAKAAPRLWFAWYKVKLDDGKCALWEYVWRWNTVGYRDGNVYFCGMCIGYTERVPYLKKWSYLSKETYDRVRED